MRRVTRQGRRASSPKPSEEQRQLIVDLGGQAAIARLIAAKTDHVITSQAVDHWKRRGIPYRYRAIFIIEAQKRGLPLPENFLGEEVAKQAPEQPTSEDHVPFLS